MESVLKNAEMSEWFKEHDWKSCVRLKRTGGSNPLLCANDNAPFVGAFFRWSREELEWFYELSEVRASPVRVRKDERITRVARWGDALLQSNNILFKTQLS